MASYIVTDFLPPHHLREGDNGNLIGKARIARIGVQKYLINGEVCNVLRSPEDVTETISLFNDLPLTLNHPTESDGSEVNSGNAKKLTVGYGSKVNFVDGWLETDINIFDPSAKEAARTTHKSFSNGYKVDLIQEVGVFDGIPYKYRQKILAGNHIALVPTGTARAGDGATFIVDSEDVQGIILDSKTGDVMDYNFKDMSSALADMAGGCGYKDMVEVDMGEMGKFSFPKDMKSMLDMFKSVAMKESEKKVSDSADYVPTGVYNALDNENATLRAKISQHERAIASLNSQLQEANKPERINDMLNERTKAYEEAKSFLGNEPFTAAIAPVEWKRKALKANGIVCDSFGDDAIDAAFSTLKIVQASKPETTANDDLSYRIATTRDERGDDPLDAFGTLPQHRLINPIGGHN
jgi:hypothetical protein